MTSTSTSSQLLSVPEPKNSRPFKPQAREIIYNVYKYLAVNKKQFNLHYNIAKCTAEATGVSVATVERIIKQARQSIAEGNLKPSFVSLKRKKRGTIKYTKKMPIAQITEYNQKLLLSPQEQKFHPTSSMEEDQNQN